MIFLPAVEMAANVFVKEGLLTVILAIAAYFFVYDHPATAGFLAPEEKEYVITAQRGQRHCSR